MSADIELENGHVRLIGELSFATVVDLDRRARGLFATIPLDVALDIDLDGVTRSDSAGLALLIEWHRQACHEHRNIHFHNVPRQIQAFAAVSHLDGILGLAPPNEVT